MTAHPPDPAIFANDDTHPIPEVFNLEFLGEGRDGVVELGIFIFEPMDSDPRSCHRLAAKLDCYVGFIWSEDFRRDFGPATPERVTIAVRINPNSSCRVFDLLEECRSWVEDNGASLEVIEIA